ncbi:MAG: hypothetical protein J2P44_11465 [Candidatus Dormibacteraeota bacterium]|nr:hypothetical protein [Candidatus Dormibacteraeota bacterium]
MLEVYTSRFRVQRQIWHIWEWVSPWPIPIWPGVGAMAAVFVQLQFGLMRLWTAILPFPLNLAMLLGIAVAVYKLLNQPMVEGRSLYAWLRAQLRYWLFEPRLMLGELERVREDGDWRDELSSWSPRGG